MSGNPYHDLPQDGHMKISHELAGALTGGTMTQAQEDTPRVLSLSEVAERLNMKRPNVAKYMARHGVAPAFAKAQGYFWWETDIERIRLEREADRTKMEADERRRRAAVARRDGQSQVRLGPTERSLMEVLRARPVQPADDRERSGLRRLRLRGWARLMPGTRNRYELTPEGRTVAGQL